QTAVLEDLEHGVTSIELGTPATAWGLDELREALEGVLLDIAPVVLAPHTDLESARALVGLLDERGDALTRRCWLR
ncbi:MAG TPA: methylmalonyl-CoA mutase, partial [Acidimicrobiaceae bacterium]|nr:methylmalonyl-CoA mutase [Acidimicrobiaceae bacterium]